MKTELAKFFEGGGYGAMAKASRETGIPYITIMQHVHGRREVSPEAALRYEDKLGIPRWKLRPDLWEAPNGKAQDTIPGQG